MEYVPIRSIFRIVSIASLLVACNTVEGKIINDLEATFVRLDSPAITLTIVYEGEDKGVIFDDVYIDDSKVILDDTGKHIIAESFGMAVSIPSNPLMSPNVWDFGNCSFSKNTNNEQPKYNPKIFSFTSTCMNDRSVRTNYLISEKGKLLTFEIYVVGEGETKLNSQTYLAQPELP